MSVRQSHFTIAVLWTSGVYYAERNNPAGYGWLLGIPFVIATSGPFPVRTSIPLEHVSFIAVQSRADKSGNLLFRETLRIGGFGHYNMGPTKDGFIAIRDVENVERLFRDALGRLQSAQQGTIR